MTLSVSSRSSAADFAAPSVTAARRDRDGHEDVREIEGTKAAAEPTRVATNAVFMVAVRYMRLGESAWEVEKGLAG